MSDIRSSTPTLENASTLAGEPLRSKQVGSDTTGNGSMGFAFRDSTGNLVLPQLDAEGRLPVTQEAAGTFLKNAAKVVGNLSEVMVAEITLTANKTYTNIFGRVSCFRDTVFRLIQVNDATTTELDFALTGAGELNGEVGGGKLEVTAGATGTQKLQIMGQNLDKASDFRASIQAVEIP